MKKEGDEASLKLFESMKPPKSEPEPPRYEASNQVPKIPDQNNPPKSEAEPMEIETETKTIENEVIENVVKKAEEEIEDPILHILNEEYQLVIYKASDQSAKIRSVLDVSDDFFELTIEDAKMLLEDARKAAKGTEEANLMTSEMRQTQKEGEKLATLNKYKKSVIRIQLPDRKIVQAIFQPYATISQILQLLKDFMNISNNSQLFITPPKTILDPNLNLMDHELVPAALLYLSSDTYEILNEYTDKISNSTGAELALSQAGVLKKSVKNEESERYFTMHENEAGPSNNSAMKRPPTTKLPEKSGNSKMPRWFKPGK